MKPTLLVFALALAGCGDDIGAGAPDDLAVAGGDLASSDLATAAGDGGSLDTCAYDESSDGAAHLLAVYTLPPTSLKAFNPYLTQADLDGAIANGAMTTDDPGPGSGLVYAGGCPGVFYSITDRGPNGDRTAGDGKTFPLPAFTPAIVTVHAVEATSALVLDAIAAAAQQQRRAGDRPLQRRQRRQALADRRRGHAAPLQPRRSRHRGPAPPAERRLRVRRRVRARRSASSTARAAT